jgi:hypothetical protein
MSCSSAMGGGRSSQELRRGGDSDHYFQIQGHKEIEEWAGRLVLGSPRAVADWRGR